MRSVFIGQNWWRLGRGGEGRVVEGGTPAPPPSSSPILDFTAPQTMSWTSTDWIQARYDNATGTYNPVPMVPAPYSESPLTTPMIAWPHVYSESNATGNAHSYQVQYRVKAGPGATQAITTASPGRNYLIIQTALTRGVEYEWRVYNAVASQWSDWRPFTIAADAVDMLVPTGTALYTAAAARSHPRTDPSDKAARITLFVTGGSQRGITTAAITNFNDYLGDALSTEASAVSLGTIRTEYFRIVESYWLWQVEGTTGYRDEALRRFRGLINGYTVGAGGKTTYGANDQIGRAMIYAVTAGFDMLYSLLTAAEKTKAAEMVAYRLNEMINDTAQVGPWPMRSNWELSHPLNHVAVGGLAGLVFAGEEALTALYNFSANVVTWAKNADLCCQDFNGYVDEEGAHRMMHTYAKFQWEYATVLEHLGNVVNLDLWSIPRNGLQAEALYKVFPYDGTDYRGRPFGDSGVSGFRDHMWASYWLPRAAGRWSTYKAMASKTDASVASLQQWFLLRAAPAAAGTETEENVGVFWGSGFGWMHSDVSDANRVSLVCRASPAGAYGHAHIDHGNFHIAKGNLPLIQQNGYFGEYGDDDYNDSSGYWDNYKRTWFKNCVTCNSRAGQQRYSTTNDIINHRTRAEITRAEEYSDYAYITMDLVKAYQQTSYVHTKAVRVIVFLKPNVFLVFDMHDQPTSYVWEWNFCTKNAPASVDADTVTITNGAASGDLKRLYSNLALSSRTLTDTTPPGGVSAGVGSPAQYFNRYNYATGTSLRTCHMFVTDGVTGGADPSAASCTTDANGMVATVILNGTTFTVSVNQTTNVVSVVES
jgi:hypothetical protein